MSNKFITAATLAAILMSGTAMAETTIKQLTQTGSNVSISGTVDSVQNANKFTLRDSAGSTIDVNSNAALNVKKGDRVDVSGTLNSELLGLGKQINAASVNTDVSATASAATKGTLTNVKESIKDGAHSVKETATNLVDKAQDKLAPSAGGEVSAIAQLPDSGDVAIRGTVASVTNDKHKFTLRDNAGKTIDINHTQAMNVAAGDTVLVRGRMQDEVAGMGDEIQAYNVQQVAVR